MISIGDPVKLSTTFIRSGNATHAHAEHVGRVVDVAAECDGWRLLRVEWRDALGAIAGTSNVNAANLVHRADVARDAADVEHNGRVPAMNVGPGNAFLKLEK